MCPRAFQQPCVSDMAMATFITSSSSSFFFVFSLLFLPRQPCAASPPSPLAGFHGFLRSAYRELPLPRLQEAAARDVLRRLLPSHLSAFDFRVVPMEECGGVACFQIRSHPLAGENGRPKISITGTTGVELCAGLHWYLKYVCGAQLSWKRTGGNQLQTVPKPEYLPHVEPLRMQRPIPWSYYQNVVTSSYSYVWWDWKRWEEEIDWMALQGINLPLAFTGQEAIWKKVFQSQRFNLSNEDLDDYFGGPAFLAWARMGNLHRWGGPLSEAWLHQQLALQKKILTRMRQLGMFPVLPAFSGNVPAALHRVIPSANITQLGNWNTVNGDKRWCCTYLLNPIDEHFVEIGQEFIHQQIKEYGTTSHIYNCDTFNENEPPTNDPHFISGLGQAVYKAMQAGDEHAIWLMQGWLFSSDSEFWQPPQMQALLHSVPLGKMVVLDLFADVRPIWKISNSFYGTPYIWCMLHNFGGNLEMYGTLETVASGPVEARKSSNSTMVGVGMCMEGIEQNPVVYDFMAEMAFRSEVDVEDWIRTYSKRRYGMDSNETQLAWKLLSRSVYNCSDGIQDHNTDAIVKIPDGDPSFLDLTKAPGHLWYSASDVEHALHSLLQCSVPLATMPTYRYDVTDVTRQVLAKLANQMYYDIITSYQSKKKDKMEQHSRRLLGLIFDLDSLLSSNYGFLLGPWLESAKAIATTDEELKLYEWNARTQLTMWFDNTANTSSKLHDYANKYWSALLGEYYLPRMSLYLQLLQESLLNNASFPYEIWSKKWISLTNDFQASRDSHSIEEEGDTISIAIYLSGKYTEFSRSKHVGEFQLVGDVQ